MNFRAWIVPQKLDFQDVIDATIYREADLVIADVLLSSESVRIHRVGQAALRCEKFGRAT